jgi:hypothetical protein
MKVIKNIHFQSFTVLFITEKLVTTQEVKSRTTLNRKL